MLLVDRDPNVRGALRELLGKLGFSATALPDPGAATRLAAEKYFAVCLVDLDTPEPGKGAEVIRELRAASPTSAVLALAPRASFALAVEAFHAGAHDVILKSAESVAQLRRAVTEAARGVQRSVDRDRLLVEMRELCDRMLERLMQTARKVADLEDRSSVSMSLSHSEVLCKVLYVDDDERSFGEIDAALRERPGFALVGVASGGAALDYAGSERYPVMLVKGNLPDLPGQLVARSLRDLSPESVVVMFEPVRGRDAGTFQVLERAGEAPLVAKYADAQELAGRISDLREAQMLRTRERRYLRAFRDQHLDLLRRHADAKRKVELVIAPRKDKEGA